MRQILLSKKRPFVFDGFNRADNALSLGNADTGQTWEALSGTWGISSNRAYRAVLADATTDSAVIECNLADVKISVNVPTVAGAKVARIWIRATDKNNCLMLACSATVFNLYRYVAGTATLKAAGGVAFPEDGIVTVIAKGDSIKCYINGNLKIAVIESFNNTATKHGIGTNVGTVSFDDFEVVKA